MAFQHQIASKERGKLSPLSSFFFMNRGALKTRAFWASFMIMLFLALPIFSLVVLALSGGDSFARIFITILPNSAWVTLKLLLGVALCTAFLGAFSAWLVSFFDFPAKRFFAWGLMLPLAVPTYLAAYGTVEFFSYTGPVQQIYRLILGADLAREYSLFSAGSLFDVRSLRGAVFTLSFVLYPYVYLSTRALFKLQGGRLMEVARSLGAHQFRVFYRILMPLARPAVALGVSLALMESINDIGAMEYLGVKTLTFSVFSVWLNQGDIAGAAQLSLILLLLVLILLAMERFSRRGQKFYETRFSSHGAKFSPIRLKGFAALGAIIVCSVPIVMGFCVPFFMLARFAQNYLDALFSVELWQALSTSLFLAMIASLCTVLIALVLAYMVRCSRQRGIAIFARFSTLGYAVPGTIIALGIFLPIAQLDNWLDGQMRHFFGVSTGLLITGSGATLIYAYVVRFMAMGEGQLQGAFKKISPSQDMAARSLGRTASQTLFSVLLPSLKPALATAGLLVFIDCLKELSATIMLRPFGVNTLATYIYDFASQARVEEAGVAAIIIVVVSIIPVIVLSRTALDKR